MASPALKERPPAAIAAGVYTDIGQLLRLRFAAKDLKLGAERPSPASVSGGRRSRFRGRGMEFEEVRIYQAGDDIRAIDWRVTARTSIPHTKLFREERERPIFIAADQRASLFFGSQRRFKSVLGAQLAALIAWAALANGDRVGGLVFGNEDHRDIRPRRSKHAVLELLHQLHGYNHLLHTPLASPNHQRLEDILADTARLAKPGSAVFLISDFHDYSESCDEWLYRLVRHTDVTLFQVFDPLEATLPQRGTLTVSNGQQRLPLATDSKALREQFSARFRARLEGLGERCRGLNIALHSFSTLDDELTQLRQMFQGRKSQTRRSL